MKKLLFLLFLFASKVFAQSPWSQLPNFPGTPRASACMFIINGVVYAGSGRDSEVPFVVKKDFYKYDPTTNAWSPIADIPSERWISTAFTIANKGYVALGQGYMGGLSELWEYHPVLNTWTQKASLPAANRWGAFSFVINGKGYVGGGLNAAEYNDLWEYNPVQNTWTQKASFPFPRHGAIAFSINNKGYMGLGFGATFYDDFYEYNPVSNTWTQKASYPNSATDNATGFSLNNKGYVGLGIKRTNTGGGFQKSFWQYDPISNSWSGITDIPGTRRSQCVAASDNKIAYIMGGLENQLLLNDFYMISAASIMGVESKELKKDYSVYSYGKKVVIANSGNTPLDILLSDVLGRKIYSAVISPGKKEIDLSNEQVSLAIFRITGADKKVSSGKLFLIE